MEAAGTLETHRTSTRYSPIKQRQAWANVRGEHAPDRMHRWGAAELALSEEIFAFARARLSGDRPPIDTDGAHQNLAPLSAEGIGMKRAFGSFEHSVANACLPVSDPRALAFVGHAPATSATLIDMAVSAAAIFADWWLEGAGAIRAENQAIRWLADLAGMPANAGGVFLSGGTIANLSALHVARWNWLLRGGVGERGAIAATREAHASIKLAARVLDVDIVDVATDELGRMTAEGLLETLDSSTSPIFAVVTSAGCTNTGAIDDLDGVGRICAERGVWFHVDGAYGAAALASYKARHRFSGIERADSLVVDPHKWLFASVDCSALIFRDPACARLANTQQAEYLDPADSSTDWNPSDYAIHLTRRARGVPLWFALTAHGTNAFADAIDGCLRVTRETARLVDAIPHLTLLIPPQLSVVLFQRTGWSRAEYDRWAGQLRANRAGFVTPTTWAGAPALRFCIVNPTTTIAHVASILATLA